MISTPTGGYTIKILNLFTLPSQAPHHAKLITIKEAETLISTSEISDAQKQHLYWLSPANLHLYLGKFRLHHSCSMLGPLTATTYFLILWKNIGSIQVWTHIKKHIEKQYEHIEKYWVYPSIEKKTGYASLIQVWTHRKKTVLSQEHLAQVWTQRKKCPYLSCQTLLRIWTLYSASEPYV